MVLLIDNFDSFTYNLFHFVASSPILQEPGRDTTITVVRNDAITVDEIRALQPQAIILSPGPGRPEDAGICPSVMKELTGEFPILGVCLGHQALCQVCGATITYAGELLHGKASDITVDPTDQLFRGLPSRVVVGRYHSLVVDPATLPSQLRITARADDGEIMAVTHVDHPTYGVQFHPESILTPDGQTMIDNFLRRSLA